MIDTAFEFFRSQTIWATVILVGLAALTYWKPKDMCKVVLIVSAAGVLVYVGTFLFDLTSSGIDDTRKFTANPTIEVD